MVRQTFKLAQPFLKWAGGKRQLLPLIRKNLPENFGRISKYYEPFIGGGAVLFDLQPGKATINDVNEEIVNVYEVVRDHVGALIDDLKKHRNESDYYYRLREMDRGPEYKRLTRIERASRIIFLNKTCYNGLFRVNSQGQFNVPFGKYKNPNFTNEIVLKAVSNYLKKSEIKFLNGDFEDAVSGITKNSFVYFDPPYHPISDTSSFTGYSLNGFDEEEQGRLRGLCDRLDKIGCKFLLSNSYCDYICKLYKGYRVIEIPASRNINSVGSARGKVSEVLVKNYG
jgi:DNA adenine methylase